MIIGKSNRLLLFNSGLAGYARVVIDRIIRDSNTSFTRKFCCHSQYCIMTSILELHTKIIKEYACTYSNHVLMPHELII